MTTTMTAAEAAKAAQAKFGLTVTGQWIGQLRSFFDRNTATQEDADEAVRLYSRASKPIGNTCQAPGGAWRYED